MPNFKPKSNKKLMFDKKMSITIDSKHKEFLNEFTKDKIDRIPRLKEEKKHLESKLNANNSTVEENLEFKDKIICVNAQIKFLKKKKKEYFLDNSSLIFEYFENKKNISKNVDSNQHNKNKLLNDFFKINVVESNTDTILNNNIIKQ